MFTGLVAGVGGGAAGGPTPDGARPGFEAPLAGGIGEVATVDRTADGARLSFESPLAGELGEGDSIAVNGVCLTAVGLCGSRFGADVMHETLRRSSLGGLDRGDRVNLELPLRAAD